MHCPFCHANDTKVTNSRLVADGMQVRRRRECLTCSQRFTTYESFELFEVRVIKRNENRQSFDEKKLKQGIIRALEKRPISMDEINSLVERVKKRLQITGEQEIKTKRIGELVMQELKDLDEVAYIRFASVYRKFSDASEFLDELNKLANKNSQTN